METTDNPEVKFLAKVSKGTKGIVDVDVATRALAMMGWSMEPVVFPFEAWQIFSSDLEGWIKSNLGPFKAPHREWNKTKTKELKTMVTDDQGLIEMLQSRGNVGVDPARISEGDMIVETDEGPKTVDISYQGPRTGYALGMVWLGVRGWIVTAPDGAKDYVHGPFRQEWKGRPAHFDQGPLFDNLVGFWTFVYKHGGKDAAKAALDAMGSDVLEQAQMTKEARERIERARMFLPEIQKLFNDLTQSRYEGVVVEMTRSYIREAEYFVKHQDLPPDKAPVLTRTVYMMVENKNRTSSLRPDYKEIAEKLARHDAELARQEFVFKNTDRISTISRRKGETPTAEVLDFNDEGRGGYGGHILFTFSDGSSFVLYNKDVYKTSQYGRRFMQFPTTFHDVKLPGGVKMGQPSEERMIEVFSSATLAESRDKKLAKRLANP